MKFSLKREVFLKNLTICSKSLLTKPSLPILSNISISVKKGGVEILSTSLESATRVNMNANIESEGETTVLGRAFLDYILQIEGESVTVEKIGEEVLVSSGNYSARFATIDSSEFPAIPKIEAGKKVMVEPRAFSKAVEEISFCAAQDESRPILTGILVNVSKGRVRFVATDGYRLGHTVISTVEQAEEESFIIPAKSLVEVSKIISEESEEVLKENLAITIAQGSSQALFKLGGVEFTSRLIEGEFPNWQKIIPNDFSTTVDVSKEELIRIIRVAAIFAKDSGSIVRLVLSGGE